MNFSLNLLGAVRQVQAEELPSVTSAHTGQQLRRVSLELRVSGDRHDELEVEIGGAVEPDGHPLEGEGTRWLVSGHRYSYTGSGDPQTCTHQLELQEAETLHATAVEIGDLFLDVTACKEWIDGVLVLSFVTESATEADQRLEELIVERGEEYFDVVRRGVSDTPVRMCFGRCLWQETDSGARRRNLVLVADEGKEEGRPPLFNEPQLCRTTEAVVASTQALKVLVEELQTQGVLSEEAADGVRGAAAPHQLTTRQSRQFSRTYDLDRYGV
ncbi:hypothetical protein [Streptomyces sp. NPDC058694]|uniref:hypothetical protein n=1 Tax=Streptomyces sp. NPDC058694 TaxID=3346603 RepID=UPI00366A4FC4